MEKNSNLSEKLDNSQRKIDELINKLENLTLEFKNMQNYIQIESEDFLWKVFRISSFSCLIFFFVFYCISSLFDLKTTKPTEKNENLSIFSQNSLQNIENSSKYMKKQKKMKKKHENLSKKVRTMQKLENSRFSQVVGNIKENHKIRSCSVEDKSYWGVSPKQLSRLFVKKFLNDL